MASSKVVMDIGFLPPNGQASYLILSNPIGERLATNGVVSFVSYAMPGLGIVLNASPNLALRSEQVYVGKKKIYRVKIPNLERAASQ